MTADLIARLEATTEGSRELSNDVLLAAGWSTATEPEAPRVTFWLRQGWVDDFAPPPHDGQQPDPTRSLDDAVALVPADWIWDVTSTCAAWIMRPDSDELFGTRKRAPTPALALCIACLMAHASTP